MGRPFTAWRQMNWPLPEFAVVHTGVRLDSIMRGSLMALSWLAVKPVMQKAPQLVIPVGLASGCVWAYELQGFADFFQAVFICILLGSTAANSNACHRAFSNSPRVTWVGRM